MAIYGGNYTGNAGPQTNNSYASQLNTLDPDLFNKYGAAILAGAFSPTGAASAMTPQQSIDYLKSPGFNTTRFATSYGQGGRTPNPYYNSTDDSLSYIPQSLRSVGTNLAQNTQNYNYNTRQQQPIPQGNNLQQSSNNTTPTPQPSGGGGYNPANFYDVNASGGYQQNFMPNQNSFYNGADKMQNSPGYGRNFGFNDGSNLNSSGFMNSSGYNLNPGYYKNQRQTFAQAV